MSLLQRSAIVTAMLAALSVPVLSQSAAAADAPAAAPTHEAHGGKHHRPDPKQMEARMEKRLQALKTALKLSGDQEAAWTTYTAAIADAPGIQRSEREPTSVVFTATKVTIIYSGTNGTSAMLILTPDGTVVE